MLQRLSNHVCDLSKLRLVPNDTSSVLLNDEILLKIASAKIEVKPAIKNITGCNVSFSNTTTFEDIDIIILCSGYVRKFPFLDDSIVMMERHGKHIPLYKGTFTPNQYKQSLAFVGMYSVFGQMTSTAEMQARYIAEVFKGDIKLPDVETMKSNVVDVINGIDTRYSGGMKEYNVVNISPYIIPRFYQHFILRPKSI